MNYHSKLIFFLDNVLLILFTLFIFIFPDTTIPFWVIGTDYNDYALAYSCQNDNGYRKSEYAA